MSISPEQATYRSRRYLTNAGRHLEIAQQLVQVYPDAAHFHAFTALENAMCAVILALGQQEPSKVHAQNINEGIDLMETRDAEASKRFEALHSEVNTGSRSRSLYAEDGKLPTERLEFKTATIQAQLAECKALLDFLQQNAA